MSKSIWLFLLFSLSTLSLVGQIQKQAKGHDITENQDSFISIARVEKDRKVGYINDSGIEVIPVEFDEGSYVYSENRITVRKGEHWFIYDVKGNLLLDLKDRYRFVGLSGDDLFLAVKDAVRIDTRKRYIYEFNHSRYTFIDITGKEVLEVNHCIGQRPSFLSDIRFMNGYLKLSASIYKRDGRFSFNGYADRSGKVIIYPSIYDAMTGKTFSEGLLFAGNDYYSENDTSEKYGFVNTDGEWEIPPTYEWNFNSEFIHGAAIVDSIDKDRDISYLATTSFLIDQRGRRIFPKEITVKANEKILDSIVIVEKQVDGKSKFALANVNGNLVTKFEYDFLASYRGNGYYAASRQKDYFYIDRNGHRVLNHLARNEVQGDSFNLVIGNASPFVDGLAYIYFYENQRFEVIDIYGNIVLTTYGSHPMIKGGLIKILKSTANSPQGLEYDYYNRKGEKVVFKNYDKISTFQYLKLKK